MHWNGFARGKICWMHDARTPALLHSRRLNAASGDTMRCSSLISILSPFLIVSDSVRIDKWLWAARFFKTRSLATDAVDSGKVRVNGERVKPARNVRIGDTLAIDNGSTEWEVVVKDLADKRGSAAIAQTLYDETAHSIAERQKKAEQRRFFREPSAELKGRPTKRDRRLIDKF